MFSGWKTKAVGMLMLTSCVLRGNVMSAFWWVLLSFGKKYHGQDDYSQMKNHKQMQNCSVEDHLPSTSNHRYLQIGRFCRYLSQAVFCCLSLDEFIIKNRNVNASTFCVLTAHSLCCYFASLEGIFYGGFTFFGGKSTAVGMLTNISISKDYGVLAEYGGAHQAVVKNSTSTLGNLAFRSVWQIKKVFHRDIYSFSL
jgi:hypothetical protein